MLIVIGVRVVDAPIEGQRMLPPAYQWIVTIYSSSLSQIRCHLRISAAAFPFSPIACSR